jgi:hypothetical protein
MDADVVGGCLGLEDEEELGADSMVFARLRACAAGFQRGAGASIWDSIADGMHWIPHFSS